MLNVVQLLERVPQFHSFGTVVELQEATEALVDIGDGICVNLLGKSVQGRPIYHVKAGAGPFRVLVVAFPHCDEPIGALTVKSLLGMIALKDPMLLQAGIEWNVVPCIDPDGATLNEGWMSSSFNLSDYLSHAFKQAPQNQVELSFPIEYERLRFDAPVPEAELLQGLIRQIAPDFYFSLHNAWVGSSFFLSSHELGPARGTEMHSLLATLEIPSRAAPPHYEDLGERSPDIYRLGTTRNTYNEILKQRERPEELISYGACSWEYLAELKPDAVTFLAEIPYAGHPWAGSTIETDTDLKQVRMRGYCDIAHVVQSIIEEWDRVEKELDRASPFYTKVVNGTLVQRDRVLEGSAIWSSSLNDIINDPETSRRATQDELLRECMFHCFLLCNHFAFVRLLREQQATPNILRALKRIEPIFMSVRDDLLQRLRADLLTPIDLRDLARAQLGSGLIALNATIERQEIAQQKL